MLHTNNEMCKNYHLQKEPMTSSSEQPLYEYHSPLAHPPLEQEWIALEEDIQTLTDYFIAAVEQNESKSALRRMWAREVGVIRSRVHTRQHPAPVEHEGIPDFFGAPVSHGHFYSDKFMKKHDAAIARKAREDALDDSHIEQLAALEHEQWMKWAQEIEKTERISSSRHIRWKKLFFAYSVLPEEAKEQDRVWARKVLESLRTTTPQTEQEQPR
jgi:hypothetical protein